MAYVSIKMKRLTHYLDNPGSCGLHGVVGDRGSRTASGSVDLGDFSSSLTILCLGKVGQSSLHCPACSQFRQGPSGRRGIWDSLAQWLALAQSRGVVVAVLWGHCMNWGL